MKLSSDSRSPGMRFYEYMDPEYCRGGGVPQKPAHAAERIVGQKHEEYARAARRYRVLYYLLRLIAGLCAGLLPFVISSVPPLATGLSIAVVIVTALDLVFNPKDKWQLYSRATDLLAVESLKREGSYTEYQNLIDVIVKTETAGLERLVSVDELVKSVQKNP